MKYNPGNGRERAVLVGMESPADELQHVANSMEELARLTETAGADVLQQVMQKRSRPDAATLIGRGKADEVAAICRELGAGLIIFDRELSPAQSRNLEDITGVRVIDRTQLILDIFAGRAKTSEGKLQVELAQLNYLLPRLIGHGVELSRLGGGIGTRGPGETKLEVDRRRIRRRIAELKNEIKEIKKHRDLLRKGRKEIPLPLAALVGYTNAGKSTLLKKLTGAEVLVEDKLFATLDPTTRKIILPNKGLVLLTDTVGFIQNLPHHLVAAFRATLEEVVEADLLLHVVDASHPNMDAQVEAVNTVLQSLGASEKPFILVYNKIDCLPAADYPRKDNGIRSVYISALTGLGLDDLLAALERALTARRIRKKFFIPYQKSGLVSLLYQKGKVLHENHGQDGVDVDVEIDTIWAERVGVKLKE